MYVIPLFYYFIFSSTLFNRVESGPIYDDTILDRVLCRNWSLNSNIP